MKNLLQQKSFFFDKTVAISFAKKCKTAWMEKFLSIIVKRNE